MLGVTVISLLLVVLVVTGHSFSVIFIFFKLSKDHSNIWQQKPLTGNEGNIRKIVDKLEMIGLWCNCTPDTKRFNKLGDRTSRVYKYQYQPIIIVTVSDAIEMSIPFPSHIDRAHVLYITIQKWTPKSNKHMS